MFHMLYSGRVAKKKIKSTMRPGYFLRVLPVDSKVKFVNDAFFNVNPEESKENLKFNYSQMLFAIWFTRNL